MPSMSTHTSIRAAKAFMMVLCGAAMLMSVGCSAGFNKQFETAKAMPIPNDDAIVGAWEGRWEDGDGHGGPLRAIVTPAGQNTYKAQFHAGYMNILTHESTVMLDGEKLGNKFAFDGSAETSEPVDLAPLHAKIGQLTLENDFLESALNKVGLLSAKR